MTEKLLSKIDNAYTLRLLEDMVRINSVVGQEGKLAEYLYEELQALGLKHHRPQFEQRVAYLRESFGSGLAQLLQLSFDPVWLAFEEDLDELHVHNHRGQGLGGTIVEIAGQFLVHLIFDG